jgi:hypothetical protein
MNLIISLLKSGDHSADVINLQDSPLLLIERQLF